jgi:hypothetical protein
LRAETPVLYHAAQDLTEIESLLSALRADIVWLRGEVLSWPRTPPADRAIDTTWDAFLTARDASEKLAAVRRRMEDWLVSGGKEGPDAG